MRGINHRYLNSDKFEDIELEDTEIRRSADVLQRRFIESGNNWAILSRRRLAWLATVLFRSCLPFTSGWTLLISTTGLKPLFATDLHSFLKKWRASSLLAIRVLCILYLNGMETGLHRCAVFAHLNRWRWRNIIHMLFLNTRNLTAIT